MKGSTPLWILKRIRKRIPALLLMTAAHVGQAALGVAFALGTRGVIDAATSRNSDAFGSACVLQLAIIIGTLLCTLVFRYLKERLTCELDRDWKQSLLHGLLRGDYAAVSSYHSGELINRLNNDVRAVDEGILNTAPNVAAMVTKLLGATAVLALLDPWFTVLLAAAGLVVIGLTGLLRRQLKDLNKQVSTADGKVSGFIQETLEKLLMVQALDVAPEMERRTDDLLDHRFEMQRKRKNVTIFANTCVNVMYYGAGFAALIWCAGGLLEGAITFGTLTAVTQLVNQLQAPLVNLSGILPQYVAMLSAAERLMELETLASEEPAEADLTGKLESIQGEDLTFAYDRDTILEKGHFTLPVGSFAVITGPSGTGKSTLLKLMLGIFHPSGGTLTATVGGKTVPLSRATRKLFAYVPQGNLLLSGTLRENLTLVRPHATDDQIREALEVSAMTDFLPALPQGLDTVLGESGAGLSEGQAQRLAIARAILSGAPVLLLDECTSALDADTEEKVLRRIRALPGRTCIAVTHRPAAITLSDLELQVHDRQLTVKKI